MLISPKTSKMMDTHFFCNNKKCWQTLHSSSQRYAGALNNSIGAISFPQNKMWHGMFNHKYILEYLTHLVLQITGAIFHKKCGLFRNWFQILPSPEKIHSVWYASTAALHYTANWFQSFAKSITDQAMAPSASSKTFSSPSFFYAVLFVFLASS